MAGKIRIVSRSEEPFADRKEAGVALGGELKDLVGQEAVVLGIPRGGIVVAREVARMLSADLDIVLSRKLGAPDNPELAIGSVSEDGKLFLHKWLVMELGVSHDYIEQEKARQMAEIARRTRLIREFLPRLPLKGRLAIVTDDGVATGATLRAALWACRQEKPQKLIVAVPVGPEETLRELAQDSDELICLRSPPDFSAVGQFYTVFAQVEDDEVIEILKKEQARRASVKG